MNLSRSMRSDAQRAWSAMPPRIVHITSAHRTDDDRIFHKECRSLAEHGLSVTVIGPGEECKSPCRGRHPRGAIAWSWPSPPHVGDGVAAVGQMLEPASRCLSFSRSGARALGFTLKVFGRRWPACTPSRTFHCPPGSRNFPSLPCQRASEDPAQRDRAPCRPTAHPSSRHVQCFQTTRNIRSPDMLVEPVRRVINSVKISAGR
jgi:hypothetical protein